MARNFSLETQRHQRGRNAEIRPIYAANTQSSL